MHKRKDTKGWSHLSSFFFCRLSVLAAEVKRKKKEKKLQVPPLFNLLLLSPLSYIWV